MEGRTWERLGGFLGMGVALGLLLGGCAGLSGLSTQIEQGFKAQRAYGQGLDHYNAHDYAGAIPLFQQALALQPTLDEAEAHLAWSFYHLGRYREATIHFRQALRRQPRWEGLYDGLGWSRYRVGRYHIAIEAFQQALELDPHYRDAGIGFAFSLFELRRYAEALPHLERLVREGEATINQKKAAPDEEEVRSRLAWTYFYLKRYEAAAQEFRKGIAAEPGWYGLHSGLGWSYLRMGQGKLARQSFEKALKLKANFPDAREGLRLARP